MATSVKAVVKKLPEGLRVEGESGGFRVVFDEPVSSGGDGSAMTPMQMLLCAFGACQTLVATAFAKAHGVNLKHYYVEVEGLIDANTQPQRRGFQQIHYVMHFETDTDRETVEKFADFIDHRCPVGDTLLNGARLVRSGIVIE